MVETHHKRFVEARSNHMLQETHGCFLLKIEAAVDRSADINQQAQFDGKISLTAKVQNALRRFVVVQNAEVILVQVAYKFPPLVGRDKQDVHFIDALADR